MQQEFLEPQIYDLRFSDEEITRAREFWKPICRFLQQWVNPRGATLDLGAGYCHFINNIESDRKYAVDVNERNLRRYAAANVTCFTTTGSDLGPLAAESVDTVFASNVYEHFPSREDVARSFQEVKRVLRPGGKFIILQPNFAFCMKRYFDFFDHRLIFTHLGMTEGLEITGFHIDRMIDQFLPYTSKSALPKAPWLVSLYLHIPLAWKIVGGQMLLIASKT